MFINYITNLKQNINLSTRGLMGSDHRTSTRREFVLWLHMGGSYTIQYIYIYTDMIYNMIYNMIYIYIIYIHISYICIWYIYYYIYIIIYIYFIIYIYYYIYYYIYWGLLHIWSWSMMGIPRKRFVQKWSTPKSNGYRPEIVSVNPHVWTAYPLVI